MASDSKNLENDHLKSLKSDLEKQIREIETRKRNISAVEAEKLASLKTELQQKTAISIQKNTSKNKMKLTKNMILPILIIVVCLLTIAYVYKLRLDLENEKKLLIEKQKEEIDYNKDAIFKDVEDEIPEDELQNIDQFKDVPDEDTTK